MSHYSHFWIWTYCGNCKVASLMKVIEIDAGPEANKRPMLLTEEE
jgi:hypothetical protein